jgi:hypothetical protein
MSGQAMKRHGGNLSAHYQVRELEGKGKTVETQKMSEIFGQGSGGRESAEDFQSNEITLHDITTVDLCHYTFVQTHGMCSTKSTVNHGR